MKSLKCLLQDQTVTDSPALGPSDTVEITDQSCYCSVSFLSIRRPDIPPQSISHYLFPSLINKNTEKTQKDGQDRSQWDGKIKRKGQERKKRKGRTCANGKRGIESEEGKERAIGCVFMLWSVSVDRDEQSKHASPLSPWSVSMETLFFTLTHVLYVHPTGTVFPTASMWFKWTLWKSRGLMVSFMLTYLQHGNTIWPPTVRASDPEEVQTQIWVFPRSEVRATISPAVMLQYNLAVISRLAVDLLRTKGQKPRQQR